jgi:hypothetical protein
VPYLNQSLAHYGYPARITLPTTSSEDCVRAPTVCSFGPRVQNDFASTALGGLHRPPAAHRSVGGCVAEAACAAYDWDGARSSSRCGACAE